MSITEPLVNTPSTPPMPSVSSFKVEPASVSSSQAAMDESDRNPVFTSLVTGDGDVVGLVAYSVYKQNKHDWLLAFTKAKGRDPNDDEVMAYIIGESTPRRLAIYRHLAHATLEGKGPDVHVGATSRGDSGRSVLAASRFDPRRSEQAPWARVAGYVVTAVVVGLAVFLAIRFGLLPAPR